MSKQIHEANRDTAVHVEDEVLLLLGGDLLDGPSVVQQRGAGEVFLGELGHQDHSLVRVVQTLHPEFVDHFHWNVCTNLYLCTCVQFP